MRVRILIGLVLLACIGASAQTATVHHHAKSSPPKLRDLPPPPLREGIGDASLKITTTSAKAQAYFNQGLNLLHCFWEFEAYRAFKEAARLDPYAAMAYWGEFEALKMFGEHGGVQDQKNAALEKAKALAVNASNHEQLNIRAAGHQPDDDDADSKAKYRRVMETLIDRYPDDLDAQAFLALEEIGGYKTNGHPDDGELYAQSILRNMLAARPQNAAANHHWIHAVEASSRPELALHSAESWPRLHPAPGRWSTCQAAFSIGWEIMSGRGNTLSRS